MKAITHVTALMGVLWTCQAFTASTRAIVYKKLVPTSLPLSKDDASEVSDNSRRAFVASLTGTASMLLLSGPAFAADNSAAALLSDLELSRQKLEPVPKLIEQGEWDQVRSILKTPPVNQLWNLGDNKNTLQLLAKATDNFELIDVKDELSLSLQMTDQFCCDNVFVYFQPGNGKVKVKEPTELAVKAMKELDDAIRLAKE